MDERERGSEIQTESNVINFVYYAERNKQIAIFFLFKSLVALIVV